jgi:hydroxymethylpyrimidine pyrophosphatase-like HAD family hydrolase
LTHAGLISFDIDGTMAFGDPPGPVAIELVQTALELGFIVGSCSDRTLSNQSRLWQEAGIEVHFTVLKQNLSHVRESFTLERYLHIGDTEIDRMMARLAGFDFLDSTTLDATGSWLHEHANRLGLALP